jgi:hypothetical protein
MRVDMSVNRVRMRIVKVHMSVMGMNMSVMGMNMRIDVRVDRVPRRGPHYGRILLRSMVLWVVLRQERVSVLQLQKSGFKGWDSQLTR